MKYSDVEGDRRLHLVDSIYEESPEKIPYNIFEEERANLVPEMMPKENTQEGKEPVGMVQNKISRVIYNAQILCRLSPPGVQVLAKLSQFPRYHFQLFPDD